MAYADTILAEASLLAFWQLQETSGTAAADAKTTRPGVYSGTYTLNQAGPNATSKSVLLSSGSGFVNIASVGSLTGAFTMEAWIKTSSSRAINCFAGSRNPTEYGFDMMLYNGISYRLHCDIGNGVNNWLIAGAQQSTGSGLNDGAWHHVVLAVATTGWVVYIDSVSRGSGSYSGTPMAFDANHVLQLGGNNRDGQYDGYLAYAALYNTQLSSAKVLQHYEAISAVIADRRTGGVVVNVDLQRTATVLDRRTGSVGVIADLKVIPNVDVATTQGQAATLGLEVTIGVNEVDVSTTQAQAVALELTVIRGVVVAATQTLQATLVTRVIRGVTLATTQGQAATVALGRGYQRVVSAIQATAVTRQRHYRLTRATTGNRRVSMNVSLRRVLGRVLRATVTTRPAIARRIVLVRAVTVGQTVSGSGLPVQLEAVATIQTRSLALELHQTLTRAISVAPFAWLEQFLGLERTLVQPTLASCEMAVDRTLRALQATSVALDVQNVTPFSELVVTATVGQAVSLSMAGTGGTAREFVVLERDGQFVVADRRGDFAIPNRRSVRFTVRSR